jgi:hypothetical protein
MPKYYFHIRDGDELEVDHKGMEFANLELAVSAAEVGCQGNDRGTLGGG